MMMTYVVEDGRNPSSDFFVLPWLMQQETGIACFNLNHPPPNLSTSLPQGKKIRLVIVRYLNDSWKTWIMRHRTALSAVYFFMDDDLFDLRATSGLSWRYRWKLAWHARRHLSWLIEQQVRWLVSTPYLQEKYARLYPEQLFPQPNYPQINAQNSSPLVAFYHGSGSHLQEAKWLYPVLETALARKPQLQVEMIGNEEVRRYYRTLNRVTIVHQMSWSSYQAFLVQKQRHIGLAPVLPSQFNAARSCTKFFDISQAGAMGIYTQGTDCERYIQHGQNGLLLPLEETAWIEGVCKLAV